MNDFRLAKDVRPTLYDVRLDLDLERWVSHGSGKINFITKGPLKELTLHAVDLDITNAAIESGPKTTGIRYDAESQTATFAFEREIGAGEHTLSVHWAGEIREALRGLYRSTRKDERYAVTQFEAADTRRAMPCFDEPEFKARWRMTLAHKAGLTAISNMAIAKQQDLGAGKALTEFAETPLMSSYLVAFCVGPFESTPEAVTKSGTKVRVWLPPGLAGQGTYARDAHVRSLEWLEDYTGIPYPFGTKVDAIGLPDFEAGAMENPGAITYRTTYLAADRRTASTAMFKAVFSVAAHELTHMWWGDLVTMAWWNDIWLNESFASMVGEKATDELNPEWAYVRDIVAQNTSAFNLDSLVSTHPISVEAKNADEASERFDAVTYQKGQGVLRMIESFIGADAFREGVRIYLKRHEWANATADDFWRALSEASGRDVSSIANAWIREPGHPLVHCDLSEGDGLRVGLRQERFFGDPDASPTGQRWPVPLVIRHGTGTETTETRVLLEDETGHVALENADWYYPNAGGVGFYRTALDDRSSALLAANVARLRAEERLALLDNQWALARSGRIGVAQVIELIVALRKEDDRAVLGQIGGIFGTLATDALRKETERPFRAFAEAIFRPQLEKLGWDVRPDDSSDERQKRALALAALGRFAASPDVRAQARRRVGAHLDGSARLDSEVAGAIVSVAAAEGDARLYERYVAQMKQAAAADAQEEARFRTALADFENPGIVGRFGRQLWSDLIRDQDRSILLVKLMGARHSREAIWPILQQHWDSHVTKMDPAGKQRSVSAIGQLTIRALERPAIEFLRSKQTPDIKETVAQATERIRIRTANAERMARELGDALGRVAQPA